MHRIDEKMWEQIYTQSKNIAERGITSSNVDMAYKVIEMYYRLKKLELMENGEYSEYGANSNAYRGNSYDSGNSYGDGNAYGRRHMVRGHYSRNGYSDNYDKRGEYAEAKRNYRNTHSNDCKSDMLDTLEVYMDDFVKEMEELAKDADCAEERDTINKYIKRIKEF